MRDRQNAVGVAYRLQALFAFNLAVLARNQVWIFKNQPRGLEPNAMFGTIPAVLIFIPFEIGPHGLLLLVYT
jgi:hypothetical protein